MTRDISIGTLEVVRQALKKTDYISRYVPPAEVVSEAGVDEELCQSLLASYVSEHSASYPLGIGVDMDSATRAQLVLYLVRRQLDVPGSPRGTLYQLVLSGAVVNCCCICNSQRHRWSDADKSVEALPIS